MAYVNLTLLLGRKQLIACFSEIRGGKQFIENLLCAAQEIFIRNSVLQEESSLDSSFSGTDIHKAAAYSISQFILKCSVVGFRLLREIRN